MDNREKYKLINWNNENIDKYKDNFLFIYESNNKIYCVLYDDFNKFNFKNITKIHFNKNIQYTGFLIKQINLIKGYSNNSIEIIIFDNDFNCVINNLPSKLKVLKFGSDFNKEIKYQCDEIFYIQYGYYFNKNIDNLPLSIEFLILGESFNQPIDMLSSNLKFLCLGLYFSKSLDNLPNGLKSLHLTNYNYGSLNNLPNCLIELINYDCDNKINIFLELTIKDILQISNIDDYCKRRKNYLLEYKYIYCQPISKKQIVRIEKFPDNLQYLYLGNKYKYDIVKFPDKIKYLKISWHDYFSLNLIYNLEKLNTLVLNEKFLSSKIDFTLYKKYSNDLLISIPYKVERYESEVIRVKCKIKKNVDLTLKNILHNFIYSDYYIKL